MTSEALTLVVATSLFWMLTAFVVVLPLRWSLVAYLLLIQIDLSFAAANYTVDTLGWENAIKIVVLPSLFLFRVRSARHAIFTPLIAKLRIFWVAYLAYAAVTCLWTTYPLSAIKMMGYFYAYSVLFIVLTVAWTEEWFSANKLIFVVWCSLLFAAIQTYFLGNLYGNPEYEARFTSFTGAQSFAPFLLSLMVLLWFRKTRTWWLDATILAAMVGLVLTGSRSVFLGLVWSLVIGGMYFSVQRGRQLSLRLIVKRVLISAVLLLAIGAGVFTILPENRVNEMLVGVFSSGNTLEDVGTFAWRFSLYQKTLDELTSRPLLRLAVGSGTSSAAGLVLDAGAFNEANVDPNRAIHDEFLRSIYEWGFPGVLLLLLILGEMFSICRTLIKVNTQQAWAFLAIFAPLLVGLTVENILADAASPGGVGFILVLTAMVAAGNRIAVSVPGRQEMLGVALGPSPAHD